MVRPKINVLELDQSLGIGAITTVIRPIFTPGLIEKPFIANAHEVPRIQMFDVCTNFPGPLVDQGRSTVRSSRKVPGAVRQTAGFVTDFPGEYRRRVPVPGHHSFDVFLESGLDFGVPEELRSSGWGEHPCATG